MELCSGIKILSRQQQRAREPERKKKCFDCFVKLPHSIDYNFYRKNIILNVAASILDQYARCTDDDVNEVLGSHGKERKEERERREWNRIFSPIE